MFFSCIGLGLGGDDVADEESDDDADGGRYWARVKSGRELDDGEYCLCLGPGVCGGEGDLGTGDEGDREGTVLEANSLLNVSAAFSLLLLRLWGLSSSSESESSPSETTRPGNSLAASLAALACLLVQAGQVQSIPSG